MFDKNLQILSKQTIQKILAKKKKLYKKNQRNIIKLKNTNTEIKNSLDGLNSRAEMTDFRISELEDRSIECTQCEQHRENRLKRNEQSLRDLLQ